MWQTLAQISWRVLGNYTRISHKVPLQVIISAATWHCTCHITSFLNSSYILSYFLASFYYQYKFTGVNNWNLYLNFWFTIFWPYLWVGTKRAELRTYKNHWGMSGLEDWVTSCWSVQVGRLGLGRSLQTCQI